MIKKSLAVPKGQNRSARFRAADLTDGKTFPALTTLNLREERGGLVAAEGSEFVADAPEGTEDIFVSPGKCYAFADNYMYIIENGETRGSAKVFTLPNEVGHYHTRIGNEVMYLLNDEHFMTFRPNSSSEPANSIGGTSCTIVNDRFFCINGLRLQYSGWLDSMDSWGVYNPMGAGIITLSDFAGKGLKLIGRNGYAYLFLEHDIWKLELLCEPSNFKIKEYYFSLDTVHGRSVVDFGDHIYFCTESGMFSFDGNKCTPVVNSVTDQVDFREPVRACGAEGKYYATVIFRDGTRGMLVLDDRTAQAYRLDLGSPFINASYQLHYLSDGKIYRFTGERGYPAGSSGKGVLDTGVFRPNPSGRFVLQAVKVEGEGSFRVEAAAEGHTAIEGPANSRLVFAVPPRGETLSLRVTTSSKNARIAAITLEFREVNNP